MNESDSFAVSDKVIRPRYQAAAAIVVMPDIVLAAPQQLERGAYRLRDPRRFTHRIVVGPAAARKELQLGKNIVT